MPDEPVLDRMAVLWKHHDVMIDPCTGCAHSLLVIMAPMPCDTHAHARTRQAKMAQSMGGPAMSADMVREAQQKMASGEVDLSSPELRSQASMLQQVRTHHVSAAIILSRWQRLKHLEQDVFFFSSSLFSCRMR